MSNTNEIEIPKRSGRRSKLASDGQPQSMTRREIVEHAMKIALKEPVEAITIMRLSRELGVTPALIHYFTGGRDKLLSAVLNEAMTIDTRYRSLTGDWRSDLESVIRTTLAFQLKWKGITTYIHTNNRHRLFHDVEPGEFDFGLTFFNRIGEILKGSGMSKPNAAMAYHLLMLFMTSVSFADINNQAPASHKQYLKDRAKTTDPVAYPGVAFMMSDFAEINTKATFEAGLHALLDTFQTWIASPRVEKAPVRRRP